MKDLIWKALKHVHGEPVWGPTEVGLRNIRAENIYKAEHRVNQMTNLELLQLISDVLEKEEESK